MKILYVVSGQSYYAASSSRKIEAMVNCWQQMGHEVRLICGGDVLPDWRSTKGQYGKGTRYHQPWYRKLSLFDPIVNTVSEYLNIQHDRRLTKVVQETLIDFKPDLYWQRSSRLDGQTFAAAKATGVPTILEWKDHLLSLYGFALFKPYAAWQERRKERTADYVVVESGVLKQDLMTRLTRDPESIFVAYNAVDPNDFAAQKSPPKDEVRKTLALDPQNFIVIYIGTFAFYHGVEFLIDGIAKARQQGNKNIRAVLVGDGPGRQNAVDQTRELGIEEAVLFPGPVPYEKVPVWLSAADVAILPDGTDIITPIKIMEYMAMNVPTMAPDYPVNREVIDNGSTGILFAPQDSGDIANRLLQLAQDPDQCRVIGEAGRRSALERFVWQATFGKVLEDIGKQALSP
jgi:glycosyltransferase involved in cell wall biosynthesis